MTILQIKEIIPSSVDWVDIAEINYGWSGERKFIVTTKDKCKYLLRILTKEQYFSQAEGISLLEQCKEVLGNIPRLIQHGKALDGSYYLLLTYLEGQNGMEVINNYTTEEQYDMGVAIGKTIKKIHKLNVTAMSHKYIEEFKNKVNEYLNFYKSHEDILTITNVEENINKLLNNLSKRELTILHNDFHLGNMVIHDGCISLIDFNRATFGDWLKEFDGIAWSVKYSPIFAAGILDEYLKDENIEEFFEVFKGYLTVWQIQMIYFTRDQNEEEKKEVLDLIKNTNEWYVQSRIIPNWYLENSKSIKYLN